MEYFSLNVYEFHKNRILMFFPIAGKNDGSVKGVRYFRCRNQHGVFVRHDKLVHDKKRSSLTAASTTGKSTTASSKVAGKVPSNLRRSTGNLSGSSGGVSSLMKPTTASSAKHK